jgi:hypothetical protein
VAPGGAQQKGAVVVGEWVGSSIGTGEVTGLSKQNGLKLRVAGWLWSSLGFRWCRFAAAYRQQTSRTRVGLSLSNMPSADI